MAEPATTNIWAPYHLYMVDERVADYWWAAAWWSWAFHGCKGTVKMINYSGYSRGRNDHHRILE